MTDEEKKAIEIVKNISEDDLLNCWEGGEKEYKSIQIVLNLIQKQQAEIEDWKIEYNHWCQLAIDRKKELEKKDKIIDLMAKELKNQFNHCEPCWLDNIVECKNYTNCINCINKYFEKKVRKC